MQGLRGGAEVAENLLLKRNNCVYRVNKVGSLTTCLAKITAVNSDSNSEFGRGQVGDGMEPDAHLHLSDQWRRGCSRYRRRRRRRLQQQLNSPIASSPARDL